MSLVKKLREETGVGIGDCKNAIEASNNDYDAAVKLLREKGKATASKKASRETLNGLVGYLANENNVCYLELACETDFVSRGDIFQNLVNDLMLDALKILPNNAEQFVAQSGVAEKITQAIATIGENIVVKSLIIWQLSNASYCAYIHNATEKHKHIGQLVAALRYTSSSNAEDTQDAAKKICMHIAAASPLYLNITAVPQEKIAEEKAIYQEQANASGKPENVIAKMVDGKLAKFYSDVVLEEQLFIMDDSKKITDFVKSLSRDVKLQDFLRIKIGA